ncbi:hypothetical protein GGI25_002098 [Coemansia spiralis]|uniref:Thioredoxin-like fold domain-containing protein n=2 Tax=Coemansia TaxID=4863 RepID=A0A9W8KXS5_9FUNG|nr:hypothetical protein BX070DRAFT_232336 [Coemansia spiralis]KAJ1995178.1 hypothetical protein EDC05_001016 [Coemansia umbellata]KAJ2625579.1 hypothetical protein GGI26_000379 [Coemansia sp. RSA 1358]KAJ2678713.1 hypothetical protein GGI25_002098 [Coemansia spiralis]
MVGTTLSDAAASDQEELTPNGQLKAPLLPPSPTSPEISMALASSRQRAMHLRGVSADSKPTLAPWLVDKGQQFASSLFSSMSNGTQRLRLPKRRAMSTERSSSSATFVEEAGIDSSSALARPVFGYVSQELATASMEHHRMDALSTGRTSTQSFADTLREEPFAHVHALDHEASTQHVRGARSMSAVRSNIALSASSRASLSHRLSQSTHQIVDPCSSITPTLPIATRPRFNSAISSFRSLNISRRQRSSMDTLESGTAELTIRISVDASQSRSYRMLLEGDSVLSDLCVLEDEYQRTVSAIQAGFGKKLVALYFAATWSADCDEFTPLLKSVSSANHDDLVVVHVSADHHPADLARIMAGSGWLCVSWSDQKLRQDLMQRMDVSMTELPKLIVVDGITHHIISVNGKIDVERQPLTCVREWKKSRSGLSWWNKAKPW